MNMIGHKRLRDNVKSKMLNLTTKLLSVCSPLKCPLGGLNVCFVLACVIHYPQSDHGGQISKKLVQKHSMLQQLKQANKLAQLRLY